MLPNKDGVLYVDGMVRAQKVEELQNAVGGVSDIHVFSAEQLSFEVHIKTDLFSMVMECKDTLPKNSSNDIPGIEETAQKIMQLLIFCLKGPSSRLDSQ